MAHIGNQQGMAAGMMKEMMGSSKMSPEMMKGMIAPGMAREAAKVVVISTGSRHGFFSRLIRNPAVLIGLGFAAGYLIHKYRNEIVSSQDD